MKNIILNNPSEELISTFSFKEWRQQIHLFDNVFTPGSRCEYEWEICNLPNDLNNLSFLDVGANDGMMSFLAEKKGAKEVMAIDIYINKEETNLNMINGWPIHRIELIKKIKASNINICSSSIYSLNTLNKKFDVVYCGNVIAWLNDPVKAIQNLSMVTEKTLLIREDLSSISGKPILEFVNNNHLTGCMFNANKEFYETILKFLGFKKIYFIPIDEYKIVERREKDFKRFDIKAGAKIYKNPFFNEVIDLSDENKNCMATAFINNRYFFNLIGWIDEHDLIENKLYSIPDNFLKRKIYEMRYRKGLKNNTLIIAKR